MHNNEKTIELHPSIVASTQIKLKIKSGITNCCFNIVSYVAALALGCHFRDLLDY